MSVAVIGDANVDLEIRLPSQDTATHANPDPVMSGGGSAANTAAALARLGRSVRFVGTVGDDAAGRFAVHSLAEAGVDVTGMRTLVDDDNATVTVIVVVRDDGERLIYVWPPRGGAHSALDNSMAITAVEDCDWLHVSGICLRASPAREAMLIGMERARAAGTPVSLDLNLRLENWGWEDGFRQTISEAIERADVVFGAAQSEICALTGITDPFEAAAAVAGDERTVVARLSEHGAIAVHRGVAVSSPGLPTEVIDTVGAGDAFNAGFITARIGGAPLSDALTQGNAVAAFTISRPGARSTPTVSQLDALMAHLPET
jgi:sugar/nucleoside kinase (ribokinase family)